MTISMEYSPDSSHSSGFRRFSSPTISTSTFLRMPRFCIVATHTDRAHIHNHVVFNSTSIDGRRKFRDFRRSGIALQKVSDLICLEHGLSVIEPVPYSARKKRTQFPVKANIRESICIKIDEILASRPKDFSEFLDKLKIAGYEIKTGANIAVSYGTL